MVKSHSVTYFRKQSTWHCLLCNLDAPQWSVGRSTAHLLKHPGQYQVPDQASHTVCRPAALILGTGDGCPSCLHGSLTPGSTKRGKADCHLCRHRRPLSSGVSPITSAIQSPGPLGADGDHNSSDSPPLLLPPLYQQAPQKCLMNIDGSTICSTVKVTKKILVPKFQIPNVISK